MWKNVSKFQLKFSIKNSFIRHSTLIKNVKRSHCLLSTHLKTGKRHLLFKLYGGCDDATEVVVVVMVVAFAQNPDFIYTRTLRTAQPNEPSDPDHVAFGSAVFIYNMHI